MLFRNTLLIMGCALGLTSAGGPMKPGVQFYTLPDWQGDSTTIVPVDGSCTPIPQGRFGSMKMLNGGMECAVWFTSDCTIGMYKPRSHYRHGLNDNTPKRLAQWLDLSNMDAGVRRQSDWYVLSFTCRSFFDNLNKPDSSANNVATPNNGWHGPDEKKYL